MKNKVIASFETDHADQCVDIFQRPDHTFGFEEFRRDLENRGLWQSLGKYSDLTFVTLPDTLATASQYVAWLQESPLWLTYLKRSAGR